MVRLQKIVLLDMSLSIPQKNPTIVMFWQVDIWTVMLSIVCVGGGRKFTILSVSNKLTAKTGKGCCLHSYIYCLARRVVMIGQRRLSLCWWLVLWWRIPTSSIGYQVWHFFSVWAWFTNHYHFMMNVRDRMAYLIMTLKNKQYSRSFHAFFVAVVAMTK